MKVVGGLLDKLARMLTTDRRRVAPSGWYVDTGEGRAVAAGVEDLVGVDLDEALGARFRLAVLAVAEANASGVHDGPDRFDRIRHAYQERLRCEP